ncbi:hypothetical protein ACVFYP_22400 [Roseomonas sp. F4]
MTSLESVSVALAHLDRRLRTIPGTTGGFDADAYLVAAAALEEAAVALEHAAEQPAEHGKACRATLKSLARQYRALSDKSSALAPVFAPPPTDDPDWDRGMLPKESQR